MPDTSTKPYLIRAIHEWCTDNGYTPYLAVAVDGRTQVPREFVRSGEIVLNVSAVATSRLVLGNDLITFHARFGGVAREISIPVQNVSAIYARENGHGMAFEVPKVLAEPVDTPFGGTGVSAPTSTPTEPASAPAGKASAPAETESAQPSLPLNETRPALGLVPPSTAKPRASRRGAAIKPTVVAGTDRRRAPTLSLATPAPGTSPAIEPQGPRGPETLIDSKAPESPGSGKPGSREEEPDAPPPNSPPSPAAPAPGAGAGSGRGRGRGPGKPRLTRVK